VENVYTLQEIFSDKIFRVPNYQRPFAWEQQHCAELLEDIEELSDGKKHYTGTIILHLDAKEKEIKDENGTSLKVYNIVDGQQRLTSLIILLHCISQCFKELPDAQNLFKGIRNKYVTITDIDGNHRPRLILNDNCHQYFVENIISEAPSIKGIQLQAHKKLYEAKDYFMKYLEEKKSKEGDFKKYLIQLMTKITNALEFNLYRVKEETDVGVIFEVMNNRGKQLTEMEKVKNYLIYVAKKLNIQAAETLDEKINMVWTKILEYLMDASEKSKDIDEDQLLRSTWLMAYDPQPKKWNRYRTVKEKFRIKNYDNNHNTLLKEIENFISLLEESCIAYCDAIAPDRDNSFKEYGDCPDVQERLVRQSTKLIRIGNMSSFLPILIALRLRHKHNHDIYEKTIDLMEKYSFRIFRLHERRSNAGQASLIRYGHELYNSEISPDDLLKKIKNSLLKYSPKKEYETVFEVGRKNWYHSSGLKYFLYEYEEYLAKGKPVQLPWDIVQQKDKSETIEHILPQDPSLDYWKERWDQEKIQLYLHDIGNLTLTYDNSSYGNKAFPEKKGSPGQYRCYSNSILFQERELANWMDWTEKELLERREKLINWAIQRWNVEPGAEDLIEDDANDELISEDNFEDEDTSEKDDENSEWTQSEIFRYLQKLKESGLISTLIYYKALAFADGPLSFKELLLRISELRGKSINFRTISGIWSGLTKFFRKIKKERLEILDDTQDRYLLKPKYKEFIQDYFNRKT